MAAWTGNSSQDFEWAVAVFAGDMHGLLPCLRSVAASTAGHLAHVTVLLTGTAQDCGEALTGAMGSLGAGLRLCAIPYPCRANAWNQFIHVLRPRAALYLFLDARVMPEPVAFAELARVLDRTPGANAAAAAAPAAGRKAARTGGRLPGPLYALRGTFVERLSARGLCLPIGLLCGEALIASFILHDLDALGQPWDPALMVLCDGARWQARAFSPYRPADWYGLLGHPLRQARAELEDAAIREVIGKAGFEGLPKFADQMLRDWAARHRHRWPGRGWSLTEALVRHRFRRWPRTPPLQALAPRCACLPGWPAAAGHLSWDVAGD